MSTREMTANELKMVLYGHPVREKKLKAGEILIGRYVQGGDYSNLNRMVNDGEIEEHLRDLARKGLPEAVDRRIEDCAKDNLYEGLTTMAADKYLPDYFRNKAGKRFIDLCAAMGSFTDLTPITQNPEFPIEMRVYAGRSLVNTLGARKNYYVLLNMVDEPNLPQDVMDLLDETVERLALELGEYL